MVKNKWALAIIIILGLLFIGFVLAIILLIGNNQVGYTQSNVALISINGVIVTDEDALSFDSSVQSSEIVELIENAEANPNVKGIIFEINSPGGSPVASDEIASAIKSTNKTTVAWIREVGASGAYWIASSSDYIVANRMSITGSIGVFASYLDFAGILQEYNVTYERLVSGKYKDIGSPFKDLTSEEKQILQSKIDKLHRYFVDEVANNRGLPRNKVEQISTGLFYLGSEALELGLIDELGGKEQALSYIENTQGVKAEIVEYKKEKTLFDVLNKLTNKNSFYIGKGIGSFLTNSDKNSLRILT